MLRLAFLFSLSAFAFLQTPAAEQAPVAADDGDKDEYTQGAKVKIEVRQENGKVVKHRGLIEAYGIPQHFEFKGEGHEHDILLMVDENDGKSVKIQLGYDRDGAAIIAPFDDTWKKKKRDVVWTDDGKIAIALTITPTKIKVEDKGRDDKDRIDPIGGDDPLG